MRIRAAIFGGTGDLSYRKLMPAFYNLYIRGDLSADSDIIAIGRRDYSDLQYRSMIREWIVRFARLGQDGSRLDEFLGLVHYLRLDFTDASQYGSLEAYGQAHPMPDAPKLIYLAVAPQYFSVIADNASRLNSLQGARIILEKPFGDTLANACALNRQMETAFGADHIFRIDHYLGKEMVRNILAVRWANPLFEKAWNRDSIASVTISALEEVGVETRGGYYDQAGAMKDMVQNHLLQILTILALEDPADTSHMHAQQLAVLNSLHQIHASKIIDTAVLGQYEGYNREDKVNPASQTETYAALKLYLDNPRWQGVPFYIRTGKKCSRRRIEAVIRFRTSAAAAQPDVLVIEIQPQEGIYLEFNVKKPGDSDSLERVRLEYCQSCNDIFRLNTPEAYERMLKAVMDNDPSWFSQWDQIETSWRYIQSIQDAYRAADLPVYLYEPGTDGPAEADRLQKPVSQQG